MGKICLDNKTKSRGTCLLCTAFFLVFLTSIYNNKMIYACLTMCIRCVLSIIIVFSIINMDDNEKVNTQYIELGCVLSCLVVTSDYFMNTGIFRYDKIFIISNIIEAASLCMNLEYINKDKWFKDKKTKYFLIEILVMYALLLIVDFDIIILKNNIISIKIVDVIVLITFGYLIYSIKQFKKSGLVEDEKVVLLRNMLEMKIILFACLLLLLNFKYQSKFIYILIETLCITQLYLIYKIIICIRLINPFVCIKELSIEITDYNNAEKNRNIMIKKMGKMQYDLKEEARYKEEYLDAILSCLPDAWIVFKKESKVSYVNNAFEELFGKKSKAVKSIRNKVVNIKDFRQTSIDAYNKNIILEQEIMIHKKGFFRCMYIPQGNEFICIFFDINKEKDITFNLMQLNREYEDLIENIKSPVIICDETSRVFKCSKSYVDLFSIKDRFRDEEKYVEETVYYRDREKVRKILAVNEKAKTSEELYGNGFFKYRILNDKGEIIWVEANATINYYLGKKYRIVSYSDITKYIETKNYLKDTNTIYKNLLDSIPEGIYMEDITTNRYVYINKKFKDIFNINEDIELNELGVCRQDLMKVHSEYEYLVNRAVSQIKENKVFNYGNIKYIDRNSNIINTKVASVPFTVGDRVYKLTIIKDMKDIKKLESLRKKIIERKKRDKIKMEFFINMSHELKTPLNLIYTSTQLLENMIRKNKLYDESNCLSKHIVLVRSNVFRLIKIIEDLIEITKMESGFYKIKMEEKDIVFLVEDMVMSVVSFAENKGVTIIFDTEIEELSMLVDVSSIERIVINILSNAIKFTNQGGYVYINLIDKGDKLDIVIEDTGIGIPQEKISSIFKRFNDVNKGFEGNPQGSGIGLSMVKSIANLIGAKIDVESEVNKGTKFTVTLDIKNKQKKKRVNDNINDTMSNVERLIIELN